MSCYVCVDNVETIKLLTEVAKVYCLVAECFVAQWRSVVKLTGEIEINNTSMSNVK